MAMSRSRRFWIISGIGLALIIVIGTTVILGFRDSATSVTEDDVIGDRDSLVVGTEPGDPGLYVYATTGYSTTSALGGARHDYPAETFLTVQPGGCGTMVRWVPLKERSLIWNYCGDIPLPVGWQDFHEWFGVEEPGIFECDERAPGLPAPGDSWATVCRSVDTTKTDTWEIVGSETLVIGGESVSTVHIRRTSESGGKTVGPAVAEMWFLEGTVLPVRQTLLSDTVTDSPIGDVDFHEEFTLELTSVRPQQ
jgi:hypothetical protein